MKLHHFSILLLLFTLTACSKPPYTNLDNEQLQSMLEQKKAPLYDIRRKDEWRQTGIIEGSRLLTFVDGNGRLKPHFFERLTAKVGKNDPIILTCQTGSRSDVLARHLVEQMGYTQVYNLRYGISSWIGNKLPVRKL